MLTEHDVDWLVDQIAATAELLGQQMSATAAALLAEDLSEYPRAALAVALRRVRTDATKLTPKAVIERIDEAMGRPGANEAWATALSALDERTTVVWTEEMAQAWEVARPLVAGGDEIGGRMAFKEAYERLVRQAREERRMPVLVVSLGGLSDQRAVAIEKAVRLGYMPASEAVAYLPAPKTSVIDPLLLLAGKDHIPADMPEEVRARLRALRQELVAGKRRNAEAHAKRVADAAADLAARKAQAQAMVDEVAALRAAEWAAVGVNV